MGNCCGFSSEGEGDAVTEPNSQVVRQPTHTSVKQPAASQHAKRESCEHRGSITSKQANSSYLREKLKAKEERQPLLSPTDVNKSQPKGPDAMVDPRQAAHIRGERLNKAEQATDDMNRAAANWAKAAAKLKKL